MKKVSIVLPTYNESDNIEALVSEIDKIFKTVLKRYSYEIIITDNCSTDGTIDIIRKICNINRNVKAIINAGNYRNGSASNALKNTSGDCTILMAADFQDPPEYIPKFVQEWEKGYDLVLGVKPHSNTNKFMHKIRTLYYKLMDKITSIKQIPHFTGFGLYDKNFLDIYNEVNDPLPYIRGFVAKYGNKVKCIEFVQPKRNGGKSSQTFWSLYEVAMRGITVYSKAPLRAALIMGGFTELLFVFCEIFCIVLYSTAKIGIEFFMLGTFCSIIFFLIGIIFLFIGVLGEYVMNMNIRNLHHPLVIEAERINFN